MAGGEQRAAQLGRLKFEILATGLCVPAETQAKLEAIAKRPTRTRSGVSGGLDLHLGERVYVNAPVGPPWSAEAADVLLVQGDELVLDSPSLGRFPVTTVPEPAFYSCRTADGSEDMVRIGQMCSPDRFCYGMTGPTCRFWARGKRCQYCSIGSNYSEDATRKQAHHLIEVLGAALDDPLQPAQHVLLGGGTPLADDMGAELASGLCRAVKRSFPGVSVYVMIAAPLGDDAIKLLHDSGADEVGFNLEFWSDAAWAEFIPGKRELVGRMRTLQALEFAVEIFGPTNTRSILIAGLEPTEETIAGATQLAAMGVMPIVSPFRPLPGTVLQDRRGPSAAHYWDLFLELESSLEAYSVVLGPTCAACQNNTLALPFGEEYREYSYGPAETS